MGHIISLAIAILMIVGIWRIFTKAGQPGWGSIIPVYNLYLMLVVAQKPVWWIILFFIPFVNIIVSLLLWLTVAERFGKSAGFGIGLWLVPFIFAPILGLGSAQYAPAIPAPPVAPPAPPAEPVSPREPPVQ